MHLLELTLEDPIANIALDEALIERAESGHSNYELLRIWEPRSPIAVLGRSSEIAREVKLEVCQRECVPVIRRCSGGAAILTAPGCLMYAVLLSYQKRPELRILDNAHQFVVGKLQEALSLCGTTAEFEGTCDLVIDHKKVSGNAMRCKRDWLLYHGTLICREMNLGLIARCLGEPKRQPEYRGGRSHADFLTCIPTSTTELSSALRQVWDAREAASSWPEASTKCLVDTKYALRMWNHRV